MQQNPPSNKLNRCLRKKHNHLTDQNQFDEPNITRRNADINNSLHQKRHNQLKHRAKQHTK